LKYFPNSPQTSETILLSLERLSFLLSVCTLLYEKELDLENEILFRENLYQENIGDFAYGFYARSLFQIN
jgi:hypothetical protein